MPQRTDQEFLEKVKKLLQKRFDESSKEVNTRKQKWDKYREWYRGYIKSRDHTWESNLVIPKPFYIIQTITPQILATIFGVSEFLTVKSPTLRSVDATRIGRWFGWYMLRKMHFFVRSVELFTETPITGSSFLKLYSVNGAPCADFVPCDEFYPDPRSRRPGDIDSMKFCFHRFKRELGDLESARTYRLHEVQATVPMPMPGPGPGPGPMPGMGIGPGPGPGPMPGPGLGPMPVPVQGMGPGPGPMPGPMQGMGPGPGPMQGMGPGPGPGPGLVPGAGPQIMMPISIPQLVEEPMYFNLDKVWESWKSATGTKRADDRTEEDVDLPELDLVEHWGEVETTFGVYDFDQKEYRPGTYEEYIVTATLDNDKIGDIIRCEPSTFSYTDPVERKEKFLKPFVASIYSIVPGEFYGIGAIQPVESLISEMKEHHDLYLDEHKRSVMSILQILERSGLTERDLPFSPYAHWLVRSHEDVQVVKFPEVNLQAFQFVHMLIDREIDRTTGSSTLMQGIPTTKRQTMGEVNALMMEATRRFTTFIKTTDHLTLRPAAFKTMILMKNMPSAIRGEPFALPDENTFINPQYLTEALEFDFAATGVEPEYGKYMKQDMFPKLLRELAGAVQAAGAGQYMLNLETIVDEMSVLYNFPNMKEYIKMARQMVPVDALAAAADSPQLQQALRVIMENAMMLLQAEEAQKGGKGAAKPAGRSLPSP